MSCLHQTNHQIKSETLLTSPWPGIPLRRISKTVVTENNLEYGINPNAEDDYVPKSNETSVRSLDLVCWVGKGDEFDEVHEDCDHGLLLFLLR